jgi:hypothetical protein
MMFYSSCNFDLSFHQRRHRVKDGNIFVQSGYLVAQAMDKTG